MTVPIAFFSFDRPLPPRPETPAPRGLLLPGNPDPRPCCLTRGLPGENVLLVMAGFPMPIFGATGMKVVEGTPPLDAGAA